MDDVKVQALAVKLQERRAAPPTISYYLQQNGKRHALFLLLYGAIAATFFAIGQPILGLFAVGFALGRQTRDLQWYRALARDWPVTAQFIDWQKVEVIAQSPPTLRGS